MIFIPYICCGDPDLSFTYNLIKIIAPYSHAIELGVPFSDPIADGTTIQGASTRALKNGVNIDQIFELATKLREEGISKPFIFMTYYNIIYSYGHEEFLRGMKKSCIRAIIVPDLPFKEDAKFEGMVKKFGISIINMIAPNTSAKRAKEILGNSADFAYLVSAAGTTGAKGEIGKESIEFVHRTRMLAGKSKNLYVGFGISTPEHAHEFIDAGADGVIVGSAIIDLYSGLIREPGGRDKALTAIKNFAERFK